MGRFDEWSARQHTHRVTAVCLRWPDFECDPGDAGGRLTISASTSDHAVVINGNDAGIGNAEEMKDKLFMPLTTGKAKGTGLGLAIVKRIVDVHGGMISFESQEGKGTTFMVT